MKSRIPSEQTFQPRTGPSPVVVGRRVVGGGPLGARKGC